jgi:PDZ domain-containing protein
MTAFDDETMVVLKDDVTGGGTEEDLLEEARIQMRESKESARNVALAELGLLQPSARITRVATDSPAEDRIEIGDVILSVDGTPVYTVCEVASEIRIHEVGEPIEIRARRDGRVVSVDLETAALDRSEPDVPMVGIVMEQLDEVGPDAPQVKIDTGRIGGPSAGLMFSLAIYDRLTPDDITHGRDIAGTGVIACDGSVQPIGGIEQKIAAAEDKGAEIFLSPAGNFEAAQAVADDIDVVSVGTFDDAVEYLAALP